MGASNSERKNLKFYSLKAKVDATNDPYFGLSEKVEDKWKTTQQFNQIEGTLVKAEIKEKEYDGSKQNVFYITLKDDSEESVVQMTHNQITYSIISTLCSAIVPNPKVFMRVYKEQSGEYWNGKCYIEVDGEKLGWAINPKDAPKSEKLLKPDGTEALNAGKPIYDSSAKQKFYEDAFIGQVVPLANAKTITQEQNSATFLADMNAPITPVDTEEEPF
jgi:hypothetical protein